MHAGPMAKNHGALPETLKVGTNELGLVIFKMYNKLPDGNIELYS